MDKRVRVPQILGWLRWEHHWQHTSGVVNNHIRHCKSLVTCSPPINNTEETRGYPVAVVHVGSVMFVAVTVDVALHLLARHRFWYIHRSTSLPTRWRPRELFEIYILSHSGIALLIKQKQGPFPVRSTDLRQRRAIPRLLSSTILPGGTYLTNQTSKPHIRPGRAYRERRIGSLTWQGGPVGKMSKLAGEPRPGNCASQRVLDSMRSFLTLGHSVR